MSDSSNTARNEDELDVLYGAAQIGAYIKRNPRQVFYLLHEGASQPRRSVMFGSRPSGSCALWWRADAQCLPQMRRGSRQ